jgi:tetratricopeptide (TPR) repeat protein
MKAAPKRGLEQVTGGSTFIRTAKALLLRRRTKEAINLLQRGLNIEPMADEAALLLGKSLVAVKQLTEACVVLEKLVDRRESLEAFTLLLRVYLAQGDHAAAVEIGRKASTAFPLDRRLQELCSRAARLAESLDDPTLAEEDRVTSRGDLDGRDDALPLFAEDPEDAPTTQMPELFPPPEEIPSGLDVATPAALDGQTVHSFTDDSEPEASHAPDASDPREPSEPSVPTPLPSDELGFDKHHSSPDVVSAVRRLVDEVDNPPTPRKPLFNRLLEDGPPIASSASSSWRSAPTGPGIDLRGLDTAEVGGPTPPASPWAKSRTYSSRSVTPSPEELASAELRALPKPPLKGAPLPAGTSQLIRLRDAEGRVHQHLIDDSRVVRPLGGELISVAAPPEPTMPQGPRVRVAADLGGHSAVSTLKKRHPYLPASGVRPTPQKAERVARWWPLALVVALSVVAGGTVLGLVVRQRSRAARCLSEARSLVAQASVTSLRSALYQLREAADLNGRKAQIVALAAVAHARLAVEYGDSDLRGAEALVEEAARLDADRGAQVAEDIVVARAYLQIGRRPLPEAIAFLFKSLETFPASQRLRLLYGEALTRNGELYLAGRVLEKLSSGNGLVLRARAELRWREGQREEARALLRSAERYGLPTEEVQLGLARYQVEENVDVTALRPLQSLARDAELAPRHRAWANLLAAVIVRSRGGVALAEQTLARALTQRPVGDPEFCYHVGRLHLIAHRLERASLEATEAARLSPRDVRFVNLLASVELAMDRPTSALRHMLAIEEINDEGRLILVEAFLRTGELGKAQAALQKLGGAVPRARFLRARLYLAAAKPYLALREVSGIDRSQGTNPELHLIRGLAAASVEDAVEAKRCFRSALRLDPQRAEAHWQLGALALRGGDGEGARRELESAITANPYLRQARVDLGQLQVRLGSFAAAQTQFDEVLALDDNNIEALIGRARAAVELGSKEAEFYLRALRMRGHRLAADLLGARQLMVIGQSARAATALSTLAPRATTARGDVLLWLAMALRQSGNLKAAAAAFEKLLQEQGHSPAAQLGLSEVYLRQGVLGAAAAHARAAQAELAGGIHPATLRASIKLQLARCEREAGATGKAIAELQDALEIDRGHYGANLELGLIYASLKQRARAILHLAAALKADPRSRTARLERERLCQGLFTPLPGCPGAE